MTSAEASAHNVANLVQDLEADMTTGHFRDATPPIPFPEESTERAKFETLFTDDSKFVESAKTHSSNAVDGVDYHVHLAQLQSSVNFHHSLHGFPDFCLGAKA